MGDGGKEIKNINERSLILCRKNDEKNFEKISKKVLTNVKVRAIIYRSQRMRRHFGSIAQLGEHLPYKQRVIGSSPIVSTSAKAHLIARLRMQTSAFGACAKFGPVVQLVRTLACHARGQGFESPSGRHLLFLKEKVSKRTSKLV